MRDPWHPRRILSGGSRLLGIDRSVGFLLAARIGQIAFYAAAMALIVRFMTPEEQGYYYTFFSIISLQVFVDLGLAIVIISSSSHEWAFLRTEATMHIVGDPIAHARLVSLGRVALRWFGIAMIVFVPTVGLAGWVFFSSKSGTTVAWHGPWTVLVILTGLAICMTPFNAILEGCNQIEKVNRTKFEQAMLEGATICLGLYFGAGLWVAALSVAARLARNFYLVFVEYRNFFLPFWRGVSGPKVDWFREIWPMQWRLGVSGFVTYFLNSMYNPVMFHYHGARVAGQTGITLQMTTGLSIVAMSWITTKVPRFGGLIAQRKYPELDMLWRRASTVSLSMIVAGAFCLWTVLYWARFEGFRFSYRVLDPLPTALFLIAAVVAQIVQCFVYYLRAHKREPIMIASVSICVGTGLMVWFLGKEWGPTGAAAGYLAVISGGAVWIWLIWRHCRRAWHGTGAL